MIYLHLSNLSNPHEHNSEKEQKSTDYVDLIRYPGPTNFVTVLG
jgi:hypothetical protein